MKENMLSRILLVLSIFAVGVGLTVIPAAFAAPDPNTLLTNVNNRHNMSNWSSNPIEAAAPGAGGTDQICIFCHTPHSASADGPLWARPDPSGTFALYAGSSLAIKDDFGGGGVKAAAQYYTTGEPGAPVGHVYPNGASRLCMSCHDGVSAVGLLRDGTSIAMVGSLDPDGSLQDTLTSVIDLSTSHPISFIYTDGVAAQIEAAYDSLVPGNYFRLPSAFNSAISTPLDSQSRMQCTTCHDPHYDTSLSNGALPPFWRQTATVITDPYTDVCSNCHIAAPSSMSPVHP